MQDHYIGLASPRFSKLNNYRAAMSINNETKLIAWHRSNDISIAISLNLLQNALIKANLGADHSIQVTDLPIPNVREPTPKFEVDKNVMAQILIRTMAFTIPLITSFFIMFYIRERITKAKLLQYVSGLNATTFWLSSFLFDFFMYILIVVLSMIPVIVYRNDVWSSTSEMIALFVVFAFFGAAILTMSMLLSFVFKGPTSGSIWNVVLYIIPRKSIVFDKPYPFYQLILFLSI